MRAASIARKGAPAAAGVSALLAAVAVTWAAVAAPAAPAAAAGPAASAAPLGHSALHQHHAAAAAAAAKPVTVTFGEMFYKPAVVHVKVGQKVIFKNIGKIAHTVADADAKGEIRSVLIKPRNLDPGQSQTVSFAKPGKISYLCTFHPTLMRGTIVVTR